MIADLLTRYKETLEKTNQPMYYLLHTSALNDNDKSVVKFLIEHTEEQLRLLKQHYGVIND